MKKLFGSLTVIALLAVGLAVSGFTTNSLQQSVVNKTTENLGVVTILGSNGPVGQIPVPGAGTFYGNISAPMVAVSVNGVVVPNGAIGKVPMADGSVVTVNNTNGIPIVDGSEVN